MRLFLRLYSLACLVALVFVVSSVAALPPSSLPLWAGGILLCIGLGGLAATLSDGHVAPEDTV